MFTEARKLTLIEAIIRSKNYSLLEAIEGMVRKENSPAGNDSAKADFSDLLGVLTPEEAEAMKQTIEEHFEKINPDDWK